MAGHRTGCVRVLFGALGLGAVRMAGVLPQLLTRTVWTCWPLPRQLDQKSFSRLATDRAEGIAGDRNQIGSLADLGSAQFTIALEQLGRANSRCLNSFQWTETRLHKQFELAMEALYRLEVAKGRVHSSGHRHPGSVQASNVCQRTLGKIAWRQDRGHHHQCWVDHRAAARNLFNHNSWYRPVTGVL